MNRERFLFFFGSFFLFTFLIFFNIFHTNFFQTLIKERILKILPLKYSQSTFTLFPPRIVFEDVFFKTKDLTASCQTVPVSFPLLFSFPVKINLSCNQGFVQVYKKSKDLTLEDIPESFDPNYFYSYLKEIFKSYPIIQDLSLKKFKVNMENKEFVIEKIIFSNNRADFEADIFLSNVFNIEKIKGKFLLSKESLKVSDFFINHKNFYIKLFGKLDQFNQNIIFDSKGNLNFIKDFSGNFKSNGYLSLNKIDIKFELEDFNSPYFEEKNISGEIDLTKNNILLKKIQTKNEKNHITSILISPTVIYSNKRIFPSEVNITTSNFSLKKFLKIIPEVSKPLSLLATGDLKFNYVDQNNFSFQTQSVKVNDVNLSFKKNILQIQEAFLKDGIFELKNKKFFMSGEIEDSKKKVDFKGSLEPLDIAVKVHKLNVEDLNLLKELNLKGFFEGELFFKEKEFKYLEIKGKSKKTQFLDFNFYDTSLNLSLNLDKLNLKIEDSFIESFKFKNKINGNIDIEKENIDLTAESTEAPLFVLKSIYNFNFLEKTTGYFTGKIFIKNTFSDIKVDFLGSIHKFSFMKNYFTELQAEGLYYKDLVKLEKFSLLKNNQKISGNLEINLNKKNISFDIESQNITSNFLNNFSSYIPLNYSFNLKLKAVENLITGTIKAKGLNKSLPFETSCTLREDRGKSTFDCNFLENFLVKGFLDKNFYSEFTGSFKIENKDYLNMFLPFLNMKKINFNGDFKGSFKENLSLNLNFKNIFISFGKEYELSLKEPTQLKILNNMAEWNINLDGSLGSLQTLGKGNLYDNLSIKNNFDLKNIPFDLSNFYINASGPLKGFSNYHQGKLESNFKSNKFKVSSKLFDDHYLDFDISIDENIFIKYLKSKDKSLICEKNHCELKKIKINYQDSLVFLNGEAFYNIKNQKITGNIFLEEAFIGSELMDLFSSNRKKNIDQKFLPDSHNYISPIELDLAIQNKTPIYILDDKLNLSLDADLSITNKINDPLYFININNNNNKILSTIQINNNIFNIENLNIFTKKPEKKIDPTINLTASSEINQYTVFLKLTGTTNDFKINFSSTPYLTQEEILSLIFLGHIYESNKNLSKKENVQSQFLSVGLMIFEQLKFSKNLKKKHDIKIRLSSKFNENESNYINPDVYSKNTIDTKIEISKIIAKKTTVVFEKSITESKKEDQKITLKNILNKNSSADFFYENKKEIYEDNKENKLNIIGGGLNFKWTFK